MRNVSTRFIRIVLSLSAIAALAFTLPLPGAAQATAPLTVVRVGAGFDDSATPLLYALKQGMFKNVGLDVQINRLSSGGAAATAVAGGSLEIGKSSLLNIIMARVHGLPFTMVSSGGLYLSDNPLGGLVVATNSTIKTAADLNGKTVQSAAIGDINTLATRSWVDAHGGDSATLKFIEMSPPEAIGALVQGRIDAATVTTPVYTQAITSGKARAAMPIFDGIGPRYMITGWFANENYVAAHKDVIAKFAEVMRQAEAYCNTHGDATKPLIADFTGLDPALIAKMPNIVYPASLNRRDIQPVIDTAVRYKTLEKSFDAQQMISSAVPSAK
jgi:NitT/TauT family transport system substrate-binding protein